MAGTANPIAVVDRSLCVARGPCASVCPTDAITIGPLTPEDRASLGMVTRLKLSMGGDEQAHVDVDACLGCETCVMACPENAISMAWLQDETKG